MKFPFVVLGLLLVRFAAVSSAYEPPAPGTEVEVLRLDWHDAARDRDVPAKIYLPKNGGKPLPVIVFSHGLGGSREGYEYLGRHWAGCGYVSVHLQHPGSDDSVWKGAAPAERMQSLKGASLSLTNIANRPKDVSFAIDQLSALQRDASSPLHGRLDLDHIGVAGHSFGGFTTMAIAGQHFGPTQWSDPRVKAAIQMSAPVARPAQRDRAYVDITIPVFHMTGTRDDSPIGDTKAEERRIPFDKMNAAETCLLIFKGGDHMVFSGPSRFRQALAGVQGSDPESREHDEEFQKLICVGSTAFWDAWLKGNKDARGWLMDGDFAKLLGDRGSFEKKSQPK